MNTTHLVIAIIIGLPVAYFLGMWHGMVWGVRMTGKWELATYENTGEIDEARRDFVEHHRFAAWRKKNKLPDNAETRSLWRNKDFRQSL